MINFTIDNKPISVAKGTTVFNAAKQHAIDIPIFCYQDRMPPFGACRVCLVEVEKMGKLQTSCTLEATEGMVVKTQTQMAVEGRQSILEFLLINHPLDCPICDRGGECPLQDQTLKYGPGLSRFFEEKRHFKKHLPLGPVLMLDRERCIVCARCTRFGDIIAGDHALEFKERGFKTEVGTPDNEPVKSKFIGNTIMICPVGALTSQVYRFRARPWDNTPTHTTCTLCPVGCNQILDSRDGEIMRTRSCENAHVNDIWLCDKGWFGYEFSDHPDRLKTPFIRRNGKLESATWDEALNLIATKLRAAMANKQVAGMGGTPLTFEENYFFQKLIQDVDHRIGMPAEEGVSPGMEITIGECEEVNFAVLLGFDITEEFPVVWLRLKQAINKGAQTLFLGHYAPEVSSNLSKTVLHAPGKEYEMLKQYLPHIAEMAKNGKGTILVGSQYLNTPYRRQILADLLSLRKQHANLSLNIMEGQGNSMGASNTGVSQQHTARQILEHAAKSGWNYLHVAGSNPAVKFSKTLWQEARKKIDFLVVQDIFLSETAQEADVVLPTASFVEKEGHFINIGGRIEKIRPGTPPIPGTYSDGDIFAMIAQKVGVDLSLDRTVKTLLNMEHLPQRDWNAVHIDPTPPKANPSNGGLTASFARSLFDQGVRMRHNRHLGKLAKEPKVRLHPLEGIKRGIKNDDVVKISANGNTIVAKAHLDEGVAAGTLVLPLGFPSVPVHQLANDLINGLAVEVSL